MKFGMGWCLVAVSALLAGGCGAAGEEGNQDNVQSGALNSGSDACMAACTGERGLEAEVCEELCNKPEDASCYSDCIDQGGDEGGCRLQCYDIDREDKDREDEDRED